MIRRSFIASLLGAAASPLVKWLPKGKPVTLSPFSVYVDRGGAGGSIDFARCSELIKEMQFIPPLRESLTPEADA